MLTGRATDYAALHSRVRVMYGALLTLQDEARLSDAIDLPALVGLLKDTVYGPYLTDLDDKGINPRQIIYRIKKRIAGTYLTIIHSTPAPVRPLIVHFFRHFELDNLKAVLRGIGAGSTWEDVQGILFPLGPLSIIPAEEMMAAGTIEAALARMPHSPYSASSAYALKRYTEEQSLFPLEIALDLGYWRELWINVNHLSDQDRAQTLRTMGRWLDMTNLMWAMRFRIYHHLAEEEIINYTLPFGYRIRDNEIRAIAAGADIARIVERLYPGVNNVEELLQEPEHGLPKLELQLQRQIRKGFIASFTGFPFHIGLPLAYLLLLELELQDLIVLVEAKSSEMETEDFVPYLLLSTNPGNFNTA
ncbi:MAG TPA: V-type ATPase subunit [Anaerolineales bacterium]|nr:V-type ATPase subunit [Anaerolineales bacterium]